MGDKAASGSKGGERRRSAGPRAIAATVDRVTRPILGRHGLSEGSLLADWPAIIGRHLAEHTLPVRLVHARGEPAEGVLHVRVASGALATELQHLEPQVVERINGYFGYRAVARLAIRQGPLPLAARARRAPPALPPDAADEAALAARLEAVEDEDLRRALTALGRRLLARR